MSKLILIKHARPEIQALISANQWHLSEAGRQDCQSIIYQLANQEFKKIFTSSEPKAIETAEIIAAGLFLSLEIQPGLHEHDRSNLPYFKAKTEFENRIQEFFNNPSSLVMGNETALQAFLRFKQAVDQIINANAGQNIAVVSHGTVITLLVSYFNRIDPFNFWRSLALPSITVLQLPDFNLIPIKR